MGVFHRNAEEKVASNSGENGVPSEQGGLLRQFVERQFFSGPKERTVAFREMVQGEERSIQDATSETFARALTEEYLAMRSNTQANKAADLADWQKQMVDVVTHKFGKHHTDKGYSLDGKTDEEIYNAYFSVFDELLRSTNEDEAQQWLTTAMIATERQIVAIQLGTGAENTIPPGQEAEYIEHVDEPEAMAPAISSETGVPLDQVRGDISKIRKLVDALKTKKATSVGAIAGLVMPGGVAIGLLGTAAPRLSARFIEWMYKRDPGRKIRWEDETRILKMMGEFQDESRKRVYSNVEVRFSHDAVFRTDREYTIGGNTVQLDGTQKAFLKNQKVLGTVLEGDRMGKNAKGEVSTLLKRLTHARQDAYYVDFDEQLRTHDHLNLLNPNDPDTFTAIDSGLGGVNPHIEGMAVMSVGLNTGVSLEQQLEQALGAIQKGVDRERLDDRATGEMVDNVDAQVTTLQELVNAKKLAEPQQEKRDELEKKKKEQVTLKEDLERHEELAREISEIDEKIRRAEAEAKPVLDAKAAREEAEEKIREKTREKKELVRRKEKKEKSIERWEQRKTEAEKEIRELTEKKRGRDAQQEADQALLNDVSTRIDSLMDWISQNPITANNQAEVAVRTQELQSLHQQRDQLNTRIQAYPSDIDRFGSSIKERTDEIGDDKKGLIKSIADAESDINELQGGLLKKIDDAQVEIEKLTKEKEEQQKIVEAGKNKLTAIEELESKKTELKARRTAALAAIQRIDPSVVVADIPAKLKTIRSDIERLQNDIDTIDIDLNIKRMGDQHQLEALQAFKSEILGSGKWGEIKARARLDLTAEAEAAALERPDSFTQLGVGAANRPFVLPAYIRTMSILGGEDVMKRDAKGEKLYGRLTKIVTPEIFFNVFIADATRAAALAQAIGEQTLPANLNVYDERLREPDVKRLMIRMIDRHYTTDLLADLVRQANTREGSIATGDGMSEGSRVGMLGKIDQVTIDRMRAVAQKEKNIPKDAIEKEQEGLKEQSQEARFAYEWASIERKAAAAEVVTNYVQNTLGLTVDDTAKVVDAVRTIAVKHNIHFELTNASYTPTQITEAEAIFTAAGITVNTADVIAIINNVRPLELVSADLNADVARTNFETAVTGVGLNATDIQPVALAVRTALFERTPTAPLTDPTAFDEQFQGKALRDILNEELTKRIPGITALTNDQLKDLVAGYSDVSPIYRAPSEAIAQVTREFLRYGGNGKDLIMISTLMTEGDATTTSELKKAMYRVYSEKAQPTMDALIERIDDPDLKAYITEKQELIKGLIVAEYQANGGNTTHTFTDIPLNEVQKYMADVFVYMREKGLGALVDIDKIRAEIQANRNQYTVEMKSEMLKRSIDRFGKKYWGASGQDLILKIEAEMGGESARKEAIKIARAIEANRAVYVPKEEGPESS